MEELHIIKKNRTASAGKFSYSYADLAAVIECIGKMGLEVQQDVQYASDSPFAPLGSVVVCGMVATRTRKKGEKEWSEWRGKVPVLADLRQGSERQNINQVYGSALSYARRYSLTLACGLASEDDDGQAASARRSAAYAPQRSLRTSHAPLSSQSSPGPQPFEHMK